VFGGQTVGVKQVDEHIWLVTFVHYDLGYFEDEACGLEPIDNPFGPKLLPMCPEWTDDGWLAIRSSRQRREVHLRSRNFLPSYGGHPSRAFESEGWRRRPDLNRGWRFCRPIGMPKIGRNSCLSGAHLQECWCWRLLQ
jgi:hypothetical protein